jgi:mono/diheme cytochrome c family protein
MKKISSIMVPVMMLVMVFVLTAFITPLKSGQQGGSDGKAIPEDLMKIFQKSCMGCHSTEGNPMAEMHLNFNNWEKYDAKKQAKKAAAICKMVSKGSMPPKSFRESRPDAVPTEAQIKSICDWNTSLNPGK